MSLFVSNAAAVLNIEGYSNIYELVTIALINSIFAEMGTNFHTFLCMAPNHTASDL